MDYVQIPIAGFYFVLGIIVGIIGFVAIISIIANKQERKNKEQARELFNVLSQLGNDKETEEKSVKKRKVDK